MYIIQLTPNIYLINLSSIILYYITIMLQQLQPQPNQYQSTNIKIMQLDDTNKFLPNKTRNIENSKPKFPNYASNSTPSSNTSSSQPHSKQNNIIKNYTKNTFVITKHRDTNCYGGSVITSTTTKNPFIHSLNSSSINNSNNHSLQIHNNYRSNNNPEYIQILRDKINTLQKEKETLKEKYSQVSEMLSNERNNRITNNSNIEYVDYHSLNELKKENLKFKEQINTLSQRVETLEEENKHNNNNNNNNNLNNNNLEYTNSQKHIFHLDINNSNKPTSKVEAIATSRKKGKVKHYEGIVTYGNLPKKIITAHTSKNVTPNKMKNNGESMISINHQNLYNKQRGGIMNLKKKCQNLNKVKPGNYTCRNSPGTVLNKKTKTKIKRPKSSMNSCSHSNTNNNENNIIQIAEKEKANKFNIETIPTDKYRKNDYHNNNHNMMCRSSLDILVTESKNDKKLINNNSNNNNVSLFTLNTQIQMFETNIFHLSSEFNKLINQPNVS